MDEFTLDVYNLNLYSVHKATNMDWFVSSSF